MPPAETLKTKPTPTITAEGQKAKDSIAAARAERTAGTITPSDLEPTPAMTVTQPEPSTAGAGLTGAIDTFTQGLQTTTDTAKTGLDTARTDYTNAVANRQGKSALQLAADEANGVNDANASLNGINEQILAQKNALNQQTQAIMNAGGKSKAQAQAQINNITREANANLANLSITQFVAQNRYDSAKSIADRAVDAQFDQEQKQIDALKFTYEDNRDLFTTAEQRLFETKLEDRRSAIEAQRDKAKTLQATKLESMRMAQLNGAPTATLQAIQSATTPEEVIAAGGQYGSVDMLQREAMRQQIRSSSASAALNEAELAAYNKAQQDAESGVLSGDQVETAQTINKDFEDEPIVKAYNEGLQSIIVLEDTLANGVDGIQDVQLVYNFMKAIDPTSVVKQDEFDKVSSSGNIFAGAYAKFNKGYLGSGGFLPPEVKDSLINTARAGFDARNKQYYNVKAEKARQINQRLGIENGADYLTSYESAAPLQKDDVVLAEQLSQGTPEEIQDIMRRAMLIPNPYGTFGTR